jgi:hypothetical protein
MDEQKTAILSIGSGHDLEMTMFLDDGRYVASLSINGVMYHFERMTRKEFTSSYVVDLDPDYEPKTDKDGMCFLIAPFCK